MLSSLIHQLLVIHSLRWCLILFLFSDIALIKLPSPVQFSDYVKPIELSPEPIAIGMAATTMGYGRVSEDVFPHNLQHTQFNAINKQECVSFEHTFISDYNDYHVICAKGSQSSICIGDVGGPLVSSNKLVGIAISTWGNCELDRPQGFTSIAPYIEWIVGITFVFSH